MKNPIQNFARGRVYELIVARHLLDDTPAELELNATDIARIIEAQRLVLDDIRGSKTHPLAGEATMLQAGEP